MSNAQYAIIGFTTGLSFIFAPLTVWNIAQYTACKDMSGMECELKWRPIE